MAWKIKGNVDIDKAVTELGPEGVKKIAKVYYATSDVSRYSGDREKMLAAGHMQNVDCGLYLSGEAERLWQRFTTYLDTDGIDSRTGKPYTRDFGIYRTSTQYAAETPRDTTYRFESTHFAYFIGCRCDILAKLQQAIIKKRKHAEAQNKVHAKRRKSHS